MLVIEEPAQIAGKHFAQFLPREHLAVSLKVGCLNGPHDRSVQGLCQAPNSFHSFHIVDIGNYIYAIVNCVGGSHAANQY